MSLLAALLLGGPAPGATTSEVSAGGDYLVETWDSDRGLPENSVVSLAQTPDGYLWVGTLHGGLARFDGTRFVNFDQVNAPALKSIEIHKLLVDAQGTLWIGNVEGGLISQRDGQFCFEYSNQDTPRSWVDEILSDHPGRLDLSTPSGMIFRRTEAAGTNRWQTVTPPDTHPLALLCEDADGVIWYRTANGQLAQMRGTNVVAFPSLPGLRPAAVKVLLKDARNRLWIGTDNGLAAWDGTNFRDRTPTNSAADVAVHQMMPCPDGGFWVMTARHLRKYFDGAWRVSLELLPDSAGGHSDPDSLAGFALQFSDSHNGAWLWHEQKKLAHVSRDGKISRLGDAGGKVSGSVQCWLEDREGNLWLGLNDGGVARLRPRIFYATWPGQGVDSKAARSVCEDENGVKWFGTGGRQVWRLGEGAFTNFTPATPPNFFGDTKVCPAGAGDLWVGSVQNGLLRLHDGKFSRPFDEHKIGTVVRCFLRDHQGVLWIGNEFGLFRWDSAKGLQTFTRQDGFLPAYVLSLAEDKNGRLWCGTALGELLGQQAGTFVTFRPADTLTDPAAFLSAAEADPISEHKRGALSGGERFLALHFDGDGSLWIGSMGGGLLRFKNGKFSRFTARDGLPSDQVGQILEDDEDRLWLGTRAGVARVSRRDLNTFAEGGKHPPNFVTYGKSDGLPALECSSGSQPACWHGRDGRLWFTTAKGAVFVNPAELPVNRLPPPVQIEEVQVDGVAHNLRTRSPSLILSPGRHYLVFQYAGLSLTAPERVRFQCRLEGLEPDWVGVGSRRTASYSYLPPGHYTFAVRACNSDGVWNEAGAVLKFTVPPYLWQTWWFKLAAGGAGVSGLLGAVLLVQRRRHVAGMQVLERRHALEQERMRIARDIHDHVGANLTKIGMQTNMLRNQPGMTAASQPLIQGVADTTREMLQSMDEIVWAINPRNDTLENAINYLIHYARDFLRPAGIPYKLDMPVNLPDRFISTEIRHNLFMAFREALNNAVKHGHPRRIRLVLVLEPHRLKLAVEDDGCGFIPAAGRVGADGLDNMRQRLESVGGRCWVESVPGRGTTVEFQLPLPLPGGPDTHFHVD